MEEEGVVISDLQTTDVRKGFIATGLNAAGENENFDLGGISTIGDIATPNGDPGTLDGACVFPASEAGTYTKYGGLEITTQGVYFLKWDGAAWSLLTLISDIEEKSGEVTDPEDSEPADSFTLDIALPATTEPDVSTTFMASEVGVYTAFGLTITSAGIYLFKHINGEWILSRVSSGEIVSTTDNNVFEDSALSVQFADVVKNFTIVGEKEGYMFYFKYLHNVEAWGGANVTIHKVDNEGTVSSAFSYGLSGAQKGIETIHTAGYPEYTHSVTMVIDWDKLAAVSGSLFRSVILDNDVVFSQPLPYQNRVLINSETARIDNFICPIINCEMSAESFASLKKTLKKVVINGVSDDEKVYIKQAVCTDGGDLGFSIYDENDVLLAAIAKYDFSYPAGIYSLELTTYDRCTSATLLLDFSTSPTLNEFITKGVLVNLNYSDRFFCETINCETLFKNAHLAIGDSLTSANKYQQRVASYFSLELTTHAKGGILLHPMVDGDDTLLPLTEDDVKDKSLITFFGGMNNRNQSQGSVSDLYPANETICGELNYALDRILELLALANNRECRVVCILPQMCGKSGALDAGGADEWPLGSGQSLYTATRLMKQVCELKGIPTVDLFSDSGFNPSTWQVFANSSSSTNEYTYVGVFDSFDNLPSNADLNDAATVTDEYYAYIYNGTIWERGTSPYPWNADQLHCSKAGYARIADVIIARLKSLIK